MLSLLYISRSLLPKNQAPLILQEIMEAAIRRNRALNITGALVYTGSEFAQALEGPEDGVSAVMASILIDPRHDDVSIVRREEALGRSFPNWGMALIGHSAGTATQIRKIRNARNDEALSSAVDLVMDWMRKGSAEVEITDKRNAESES